jgi:hypothetical protein
VIKKTGIVFIAAIAVLVISCGRQVTPNPAGLGPGGAPPGYMAVFFNVVSPFNFANYQYMVVLNTTGDGRTPSTDTFQTNWDGYSFAMIALGNGVSSFAEPILYVRSNQNPHVPPQPLRLGTNPQQFSYNMNANGSGSEFSLLVQKRIFSATPAPSPTPTSNVWTFNAFVAQPNAQGQWTFYDSMGAGGPVDPQWNSPQLNMLTCFDSTYYALDQTIGDPAAEIVSIEFANNPASAPCSSGSHGNTERSVVGTGR